MTSWFRDQRPLRRGEGRHYPKGIGRLVEFVEQVLEGGVVRTHLERQFAAATSRAMTSLTVLKQGSCIILNAQTVGAQSYPSALPPCECLIPNDVLNSEQPGR